MRDLKPKSMEVDKETSNDKKNSILPPESDLPSTQEQIYNRPARQRVKTDGKREILISRSLHFFHELCMNLLKEIGNLIGLCLNMLTFWVSVHWGPL
ncbi:unnamed protein product [Lactuca virosa]|uniref:Uncharacterized protein n=1 Tax=Lactuca virosa TaxID=75947 RepID=A0AAU9PTA9_9ASTR|nr:unnamed protein product [Lactuca virosa]